MSNISTNKQYRVSQVENPIQVYGTNCIADELEVKFYSLEEEPNFIVSGSQYVLKVKGYESSGIGVAGLVVKLVDAIIILVQPKFSEIGREGYTVPFDATYTNLKL